MTLTDSGKVWMPDTFFRNEKVARFHKILAPNLYIRVFPDGDVLYSIRYHSSVFMITLSSIRTSLVAACSMNLARFPLDSQTCYLYLASCKTIFLHPVIYIYKVYFRWLDQE